MSISEQPLVHGHLPEATLLLGHSPDPDDAFMFYAMAAGKIPLHGYRFEHILQDIQTLNERALRQELHVSAVSIHAYAHLTKTYALLPCGASMGDGYGPMFVVRADHPEAPALDETLDHKKAWLGKQRIAVPGLMTSAFLAAQLCLEKFDYIVIPFDQIFEALRTGAADVGLIIHEGQLTYAQEGFAKILDLGTWWKNKTGLPLPLGGNVIRKDFSLQQRHEINEIVKASIRYGLDHRRAAVDHSMAHARGMEVPLADQFIGMYVNDYTLDYGEEGRAAIRAFLGEAADRGLVPGVERLEFVE
ncbi:MAG: ABC transporter substrate-binding protein [Chthoniobacterales bacterium]|nr:ABC transporter substrate-binding protein [Chthoniobacterales bacterium]